MHCTRRIEAEDIAAGGTHEGVYGIVLEGDVSGDDAGVIDAGGESAAGIERRVKARDGAGGIAEEAVRFDVRIGVPAGDAPCGVDGAGDSTFEIADARARDIEGGDGASEAAKEAVIREIGILV